MTDDEKFEEAKKAVQFCPECAQPLEQHPNSIFAVSCYIHGDFILTWLEGRLVISWQPLRLSRVHIRQEGDGGV